MKQEERNDRPDYGLMKQSDVVQFYHLQFPRWLLEDRRYMPLGIEAKFVYMLLFNRFQLSKHNGWINDEGEVFVIYTRRELAEKLNASEKRVSAAMNELRGSFRPEFLNRLDETILFKPLTKENIGNIITLLMRDLNRRLADREVAVELSAAAEQYVTDHGYDPTYGARPLKRFLQKHVETLVARLMLKGDIRTGETIVIDAENGKLTAKQR